jgi:gliding motility-associated-like protein
MRFIYATLFFISLSFSNVLAQATWTTVGCTGLDIEVAKVFINSCCDPEGYNEFMYVKTGNSPLFHDNLQITGSNMLYNCAACIPNTGAPFYSPIANVFSSNAAIVAQLNSGVNNCPSNNTFLPAPNPIPPNSILLITMSSVGLSITPSASCNPQLSDLCGRGPVYVLSGNYTSGGTGQYGFFKNGLPGCPNIGGTNYCTQTVKIELIDGTTNQVVCSKTASYDLNNTANADGNYILQSGAMGVGGCYEIPPCIAPPPPALTPIAINMCQGQSTTQNGQGMACSNCNVPGKLGQYNVYTAASGGSPVFIGANFPTGFAPISGLPVGTTTYYAEQTGFCPSSRIPITINVSAGPSPTASIGNNPNCNGTATGVANATAVNGVGPYTYQWPGGATTPAANNLAAGTYIVTVTDAYGCKNTSSITLVDPPLLTTTPGATTAATCIAPGTATMSAAGGTPTYTYNWGTSSTPTVTGQPGNYTVTVTDSKGCTKTQAMTIPANNTLPTAVANSPTTLTCAVTSATINGTGSSTGTMTYNWSGPGIASGGTTLTPTINQPGTYTITVTNTDNGCTKIATTTVAQNIVAPQVNAGPDKTLNCSNNQQATLSGSSNVPGATYSWSPSGGTSATPSVTTPGTYTVTVTNPVNGCKSTDDVVVTLDITAPVINPINNQTITCSPPNATLYVNATGANLQYAWSPNGSGQNPVVTTAGTYTVTVTNGNNGCTATQSAVVTVNNTPPIAVLATPPTLTCTTGGVVQLSATNSSFGNGYVFTWYGPGGNIINTSQSPPPTVSTPGNYQLVITDVSNGCTATASTTVIGNVTPPTGNAGPPVSLNCFNNGNVIIGVGGGPNQTYSWSSGSTPANPTQSVSTPGVYNLTITNNTNGCTTTSSVTVTDDFVPPVMSPIAPVTVNCYTPTPTINTSTVGSNLIYTWTPSGSGQNPTITMGGTYTVTVTNSVNGCKDVKTVVIPEDKNLPTAVLAQPAQLNCFNNSSVPFDPTGTEVGTNITYSWSGPGGFTSSSLVPPNATTGGIYTLTVTNSTNGCTKTISKTIDQNTTLPTALAGPPQTLNCFNNGTVSIGGASSSGANFTYNWSNSISTATQSVTTPGTYTLTVSDTQNGCTKTSSVVISEDKVIPTIDAGADLFINCYTPLQTINAVSGNANGSTLTYAWAGPGISAGGTTLTPSINLGGTYTVTVTNPTNGCTSTDNMTVTSDLVLPTAVATVSNGINCNNPTAVVNATGSSSGANYTYNWTGPNNFTGNTINPTVNAGGIYIVTVTNTTSGCTKTAQINVAEDKTAPTANAGAPTSVTCSNPTIQINGSGSTGANFSYSWTGPGITGGSTTLTPTINQAGTYVLTVTNSTTGCTSTSQVVVAEDKVYPVATATGTGVVTCFNPTLSLGVNVTSGTNLQYLWSAASGGNIVGAANSQNITVNQGGTYNITITNAVNGCSITSQTTTTSDNLPPTANATASGTIDCNNTTATLDGTSSSQGAIYTYNWTGPGFSNNTTYQPTVTVGGAYTISITNTSNGCTAAKTIVVNQDKVPPAATVAIAQQITCISPTANIQTTGNSSFLYSWTTSNGNIQGSPIGQNIIATQAGTYTLNVINPQNGCQATYSTNVVQNTTYPDAVIAPPGILSCTNPVISLNASNSSVGGVYSYSWTGPAGGFSSGQNTYQPQINVGGTYTFKIVDNSNGCEKTASVTVQDNKVFPIANAYGAGTIDCSNTSIDINGFGSSSSSGGNTYTYNWQTANGGNITSGQGTLQITVNKGGLYTIVVTDVTNSCTATKSVSIVESTSKPVSLAGPAKVITCTSTTVQLQGGAGANSPWYAYQWYTNGGNVPSANGGNTKTPTVSQVGTYYLVVTDQLNNCKDTSNTTVTLDQGVPTANAGTKKEITCVTNEVELDGSGSSSGAGINFTWTGPAGGFVSGQTTLKPKVNKAGTYKLLITNTNNNCTGNAEVQVEDNRIKPTLKIAKPLLLNCATANFTLSGTGSSTGANISYLWTTAGGNIVSGATTLTPAIDKPGVYNLKIKNSANSCEKDSSITVLENSNKPVPLIAPSVLLTCTQPTQILDASGSSKIQNAKIKWITPSATAITSGGNTLKPTIGEEGKYKLILTDTISLCKDSITIDVAKDANIPTASAGATAELNCTKKVITLQGTATVKPSITYSWTTVGGNIVSGGTTTTPEVDKPGKYTLKVFDSANQCLKESSVDITLDTTKPSIKLVKPSILNCKNAVMPLDASASSTGAGFPFTWNTPSGTTFVSGGTTLTPLINKPGTYSITITNSKNTCVSVKNIDVTQDIVKPQANVTNTDTINCRNASVKLKGTASANSGFYTFKWNTPLNGLIKDATTLSPTANQSGNYQLIVTDTTNFCSTTAQLTVIKDVQTPVVNAGTGGNLTCIIKDLVLTGTATNGAAKDLKYTWTTTKGNIVGASDILSPKVDAEGKYFLEVENKINGCKAKDSTIVTQDASVPIVQIITNGNLDCKAKTLILDGSNSTQGAGVLYTWTTKNGGNIVSGANTLTPTINSAGVYILQINNTNNKCIKEIEKTIKIDTLKPLINVSQDIITCAKPVIELAGKIFQANKYTFEWITTTGGIVSKKDTLNIGVTKKGVYTLKVKNSDNECESTKDVNVLEDKVLPTTDCGPALEINCQDSVLILQGDKSSKGPDFVYKWTTTGGNIKNGETTLLPEVDQAGLYYLSIFNKNNGCSNKDTVQIKINKQLPKIVMATPDTLTCKKSKSLINPKVTVTGTPKFVWDGAANTNIVGDKTLANISVDRPGTYSLTVTDEKNKCVSKTNVTVVQDTIQPKASAGVDIELNCKNPTIDVQGVGIGKQKLTYLWTTTNGEIVANADKAKVTVKSAGFYKLLVTNTFNGCSATDDMEVTFLGAPKAVVLAPEVLTCTRKNIILDSKGSDTGTNYVYTWSSTSGSVLGTDVTLNITQPGTYNFKVLNTTNDCEKKEQVIVTQDIVNPTADAGPNGTINCDKGYLILDGKQSSLGAKYKYQWTGGLIESGANTPTPKVTAQSVYTLLVTNTENGCLATDTVSILSLKPALLATETKDAPCNNAKGSIAINTITGGTQPFTYSIDGGKKYFPFSKFTNLKPGEYKVFVQDSKGCEDSTTLVINNPEKLTILIPEINKVKIGDDIQLNAKFSPSDPKLKTVTWTPDSMLSCKNCLNPIISNPLKSIYFKLKVVNENGCEAETYTTVEVDKAINVFVPTTFSPNGDSYNDKFTFFGNPELVLKAKWFRIHDRWGDMVFEEFDLKPNDTTRGWDGSFRGSPVNPAVYVWSCEVLLVDGRTIILKGDVTIQR